MSNPVDPPISSLCPKTWAAYYRSIGLHPIPVLRGTKRPAIEWKDYQERPPTTEEMENWNWLGGVGIVTTGLICVDCDKDGERLIRDRELPPSWTVKTGGGGLHRYYTAAGRPGRNKVAIVQESEVGQVDIRADGGFAVLPPTEHPQTRRRYEWVLPPWSPIRLAPAPAWVYEKLSDKPGASKASGDNGQPEGGEKIPEGKRNAELASLAGSMRRRGMTEEEILVALLAVNAARCDPPLSEVEVRGIAGSIAGYEPEHRPPEQGESPARLGRLSQPLSELLSVPDEPIPWLAERLLVAGANGMIGGEPKTLKSWLALYLGLCLALGLPIFGRYHVPQPVRVLYLQEEDGKRRVRRRIRQLLAGLEAEAPKDEFFRYAIKVGLLFDDEEGVKQLRAELAEFKPAIVIGDVFELMHLKDGDKRAEMKPIFRTLDRLRDEFGCGFLLADHFKKSALGGSRRGGQRLAGTVGKHAWVEGSIYIFPTQAKNRVAVETELKDGAPESFGLALEDPPGGGVVFRWEAEAQDREAEAKAKVWEALVGIATPGEWVPVAQVATAAGVARNTAKRYLDALVDEDKKAEREKRQIGKAKGWCYRPLTA